MPGALRSAGPAGSLATRSLRAAARRSAPTAAVGKSGDAASDRPVASAADRQRSSCSPTSALRLLSFSMYSLAAATSWPRSFRHSLSDGRPDPVDVERDAADGDVDQEHAGRQPEQRGQSGANERGLTSPGSRRKWSTPASVCGRSTRPSGRNFQLATWPSVRVARRLQRRGVAPQLAVLVGIGDRDARGDARPGRCPGRGSRG